MCGDSHIVFIRVKKFSLSEGCRDLNLNKLKSIMVLGTTLIWLGYICLVQFLGIILYKMSQLKKSGFYFETVCYRSSLLPLVHPHFYDGAHLERYNKNPPHFLALNNNWSTLHHLWSIIVIKYRAFHFHHYNYSSLVQLSSNVTLVNLGKVNQMSLGLI